LQEAQHNRDTCSRDVVPPWKTDTGNPPPG